MTDENDENYLFKKTINVSVMQQEVIVNSLVRIEMINRRLNALDFVMRGMDSSYSDEMPRPTELYAELYKKLSFAYRDMFMFATLFPELKKFALSKIEDDVISPNRSIMQFLDPDGKHPGGYRNIEETNLRETITLALERAKGEDKEN